VPESFCHFDSGLAYFGLEYGLHGAHVGSDSLDEDSDQAEQSGAEGSEYDFLHGHCPL